MSQSFACQAGKPDLLLGIRQMNIIRDPRRSLANAEITKNVIKDVVSINFAKNRT